MNEIAQNLEEYFQITTINPDQDEVTGCRVCATTPGHRPNCIIVETIKGIDALTQERDRLQHVIDCADTPLMRDVLADLAAAESREAVLNEDLAFAQALLAEAARRFTTAEWATLHLRVRTALAAVVVQPDKETRWYNCIKVWPECQDGSYDPRCCRFPKPCNCDMQGLDKLTLTTEQIKDASGVDINYSREDAEMWCERCKRRHGVVWSVSSDIWNAVMRGGERGNPDEFGFCCATCFMQLANERNIGNLMWRLAPDLTTEEINMQADGRGDHIGEQ